MSAPSESLTFGPVPSRRLGRSVGINNIPAKVCSYSCVYCQVGRTLTLQVERRPFHDPEVLLDAARRRTEEARREGAAVDFLTFVPDGEPTLDLHLGRAIRLLRTLGFPVGVITNGSLIGRPDVREDLMLADWVSLKVDAVSEEAWRRIDRPHRSLDLESILEGALAFAAAFPRKLVTETMLVHREGESDEQVRETADFLARLRPAVAYLSVPTRPPAEAGIHGPDADRLNRAFQIFRSRLPAVEYLIGYEGDAFASTGQIEHDLLAITAVHPMRRQAVEKMLADAGASWSLVETLLTRGELLASEHDGHTFYLRRLRRPRGEVEGQQ
jgi:wyosine [tRNA(Phe)-imidazoG37] synthetase (radical SAM superfamily)